nr:MAG TPA: scarabaecin peptide, antimicrobial peptide, beetle [Caudoviricetes sp.]
MNNSKRKPAASSTTIRSRSECPQTTAQAAPSQPPTTLTDCTTGP